MKKNLLFIVTALTLLGSTSNHAAGPAGSLGYLDGANDNPHNLSVNSTRSGNKATSEKQICIFCHTPHSATPKSALWNRPDPAGPFPFRVLTSPTKISDAAIVNTTRYSAATSATEGYPNGTSKLCLSCHDGMTAMGVLAHGEIVMSGTGFLSANMQISLSNSHPISFIYNSAVETYLGTASYNVPSVASGYLDGDSRVQCTSCHQPHQDTRFASGTNLPFWRAGTGNPATDYNPVCQACHVGTPVVSDEHNF